MANIRLDTRKLDQLIKQSQEKIPEFVATDGVDYGIFQEFTERGHPSLIPAFERHIKALPDLISQAIEQGGSLEDALAEVARRIERDWKADVNVDTGAYRDSIHVEER